MVMAMGKVSSEEFKVTALQKWRESFSNVRQFLDWCQNNNYEEFSRIKKFSRIKEYYERNFLHGEVLMDGKWKKDDKSHSLLHPVWYVADSAPKELENKVYNSAHRFLWMQMSKGKHLDPEGILRGILLIIQSAFCSILGLNTHQFLLSCDYNVMDFLIESGKSNSSIDKKIYNSEILYPLVNIVEQVIGDGELPSLNNPRLPLDQFTRSALERWTKSFPLVVGFVDWIEKHNYSQFDKITNTTYPLIQEIYHECVLLGKNQYGTVDPSHLPILETISWTCENVTPGFETKYYQETYLLARNQDKWLKLGRQLLLLSLLSISMSAMAASFGVTEADLKKANVVFAKEFKRAIELFVKFTKENIEDVRRVAPLVNLVAQMLNVSASRIFDSIPVTGLPERPTRTGGILLKPVTEAKEPEKVIPLECPKCGHSDVYKEQVIKTFGSVRCKECGTKIKP
jgi:predicted RNA-binding Zn-ribbon protein involved in translation (DUF1610 family)